eukprot:795575-Alexandrium_andersonii.AAC.1
MDGLGEAESARQGSEQGESGEPASISPPHPPLGPSCTILWRQAMQASRPTSGRPSRTILRRRRRTSPWSPHSRRR